MEIGCLETPVYNSFDSYNISLRHVALGYHMTALSCPLFPDMAGYSSNVNIKIREAFMSMKSEDIREVKRSERANMSSKGGTYNGRRHVKENRKESSVSES